MSVQIRTGKTTSVSFEPLAPPMVPLENALSAEQIAKGADSAGHRPFSSPLLIGSVVVLGVGLAAAIAGVALGVSSAGDAASAKNRMQSIAQAQAFANSANSKAVGANILYGVGGAAVVGGGVMLFFSLPLPEPGMKPAPK